MPKKVFIPANELFDEKTEEFIYTKDTYLTLEHSLVSLSRWESIWHKPFLTKDKKTYAETLSYIQCMTLNQNVDPNVYRVIPNTVFKEIDEYITTDQTATWFSETTGLNGRPSREIITSEVIYYWMVTLQIPYTFEKWHLSRLITLIKVCNVKNAPKKKMSRSELINRNRALNAERRKRLGSKG